MTSHCKYKLEWIRNPNKYKGKSTKLLENIEVNALRLGKVSLNFIQKLWPVKEKYQKNCQDERSRKDGQVGTFWTHLLPWTHKASTAYNEIHPESHQSTKRTDLPEIKMQRGHRQKRRGDRYAVRNQTWQHGASGVTDALLFAEKRERKKKEEK